MLHFNLLVRPKKTLMWICYVLALLDELPFKHDKDHDLFILCCFNLVLVHFLGLTCLSAWNCITIQKIIGWPKHVIGVVHGIKVPKMWD